MKECLTAALAICLPLIVTAQTTKTSSWRPDEFDTVSRRRVYHPEPILFVHGINANDAGWSEAATPALRQLFLNYDLPDGAVSIIGWFTNAALTIRYNAPQTNYLHTFNYGDPPGVLSTTNFNRQSFDHIKWNAWEPDKNEKGFTA